MSTDITILLSDSTSSKEKTLAATNIINDYNLRLTTDQIWRVFKFSRKHIYYKCNDKHNNAHNNVYDRHEYFFNYLLTKNIDMFTAVIRMYNDVCLNIYESCPITYFVRTDKPFKIGENFQNTPTLVIGIYKKLLNYNDFDISDLKIRKICKKKIQKYRDEKYSGKLTKVVMN